MQKIIVTGAAGHLGSHLVPELVREGFAVTGVDVLPAPSSHPAECPFVQLDLADRSALPAVLKGVDMIVHCGSIHPWKPYSDERYWDGNVKGTWNLYAEAAAAGVGKIVLTSSIAAVGYGGPETIGLWPLPESYAKPTGDLYSVTKRAQEEIAAQFAAGGKVHTLALRPPAFMPMDTVGTAFALMGAYALVEDMVSAHVAAVRVMSGKRTSPEPLKGFETFYITNALPYTAEDEELFEPGGMVGLKLAEKHWPEHVEWLKRKGFREAWMPAVYDISKAERILGWRPKIDLSAWLCEHGV